MFDGGNSPGTLGFPAGKNSASSYKSAEALERRTLALTWSGQRNILVKDQR